MLIEITQQDKEIIQAGLAKLPLEVSMNLFQGIENVAKAQEANPMLPPEVEELAKELHEAGREAVESGNTVAAEHHGEESRKFIEWDDITEYAKEGRRMQAKYLLEKFFIRTR